MLSKLETSMIEDQMKALCSELLNRQEYQELRRKMDTFAEDDQAIQRYESFIEKQRFLQRKEQEGTLTQEEIDEYNREESSIYGNSVIREFLYAQREFTKLHQWVGKYFLTAIELDRLPEAREVRASSSCGCGGNCGCGGGH
jgi:cell fate (sporulation/competence/biofilm development) regulator YlbF (YheA/YmcA/DUF963 family)